jgi:hypothetical protein
MTKPRMLIHLASTEERPSRSKQGSHMVIFQNIEDFLDDDESYNSTVTLGHTFNTKHVNDNEYNQ